MAVLLFGEVSTAGLKRLTQCRSYLLKKDALLKEKFHSSTKVMVAESATDIVIPRKIKRLDTDVLEALASTISRDYTAPNFKFHDDPYFIPASNVAKRVYALSKESGRKAAKWIRDEYPLCFEDDHAQPHIKDFMPKPAYTKDSNVTITTLLECIWDAKVSAAVTVYEALQSKNVSVDNETLQSFLEFLCFYNGKDPPDEDFIEERWFRQTMQKDRKMWLNFSLVESVFNSLEPKEPRAYATMIRGLAKYFQVQQAWKLYKEMQEKAMPVDVGTYNSLLNIVCYLRDSSESRWQLTEELLTNMHREGVKPNLGTLNATLETISRLGSWREAKKVALQILAEMKNEGIEPSLASYYYILVTFCRERGPISTILYDIMNILEGHQFSISNPKDVFFFVTAMDVCHTHLHDKNLAFKVHDLLLLGNNYSLIGDSMKESIYYQHLFKLLCGSENIDMFFEFYHKLVPHIYTPEPSVMLEIIRAVDVSGALQYIPQIWSDMVLFEHTSRENLLEMLLETLASNKPNEMLQKQFVVIVTDIQQRIDAQKIARPIGGVQWTGSMLGNVMVTYLNGGDYQNASAIMNRCTTEQHSIAGLLTVEHLQLFVKESIVQQDTSNAIVALKYMSNVGYTEAALLAKECLEKLLLSEKEAFILKETISEATIEKPEEAL